jgi:hypothetical protein
VWSSFETEKQTSFKIINCSILVNTGIGMKEPDEMDVSTKPMPEAGIEESSTAAKSAVRDRMQR